MAEAIAKVDLYDPDDEDIHASSTDESVEAKTWGIRFPQPPAKNAAGLARILRGFSQKYGRAPLLPGECEVTYWDLVHSLAHSYRSSAPFYF